jgi:hypothetical protein
MGTGWMSRTPLFLASDGRVSSAAFVCRLTAGNRLGSARKQRSFLATSQRFGRER